MKQIQKILVTLFCFEFSYNFSWPNSIHDYKEMATDKIRIIRIINRANAC
jgi:hypothetical protein